MDKIVYGYWSTQRPIGPGCYPKPDGNKVVLIHNFDTRTFCEEINREAYGFICYEKPLGEMDQRDYELCM